MKFFTSLIFISVLLFYTEADCPESCPDCSNRRVGESWNGRAPAGECREVICTKKSGGRYSWGGRGCPTYKLRAGCTLSPMNTALPYPACCPTPICPRELLQTCPEKCPGCERRSIGETWKGRSTSGCFDVTCKKTGEGRFSWSSKGCTTYQQVPSYCMLITGNPSSPYPGCCNTLSCREK